MGSRSWPISSPYVIFYCWSVGTKSASPTVFEIQIYLGHDHDLSGSRDVTGHVTIWFPISYGCSIVTESLSPDIFRDNGPQTYWGHDLDLSRSRDVIGHVTNRFAICNFLLVSHWNRVSIFNRFRDIWPAHTHTQKERKKDTCCKWFYILFHSMYCIGQTISICCFIITVLSMPLYRPIIDST